MADVIDFFPRPRIAHVLAKTKSMSYRETQESQQELKKWLVRRVECVRGSVDLGTDLSYAMKY